MPRPERPLEGEGPLAEFAAELRLLRKQAGSPGYRELSARAHYSVTTLSEAAGGRKLPSLTVTLAYVRACGGSAAEWEARWRAVASQVTAPDADYLPSPYVGLMAFQPEDADRFFGRERLVDELVARLDRNPFLAVFGASGMGKSSLLRAGLVPRMAGRVVLMTPGPHPMRELANRYSGDDVVLVVDQFEEVFTLCRDPDERARFISGVVNAAGGRNRVVLGVRADFYAHCSDYPELVDALLDAQVLVGPMTTDELRRAITRPAVDAGCVVEGALLAAIVADAAGQPGALPLVSHALRETWLRRRGNTLTLAGFQAAGGIQRALARTAETLYTGLTAGQQRVVKDLFLRLTALGEGTEDTRRRITRDELDTDDPDTDTVLDRLAEARLVIFGENTVDLAHEALIRAWPRLRRWLAEDRDGLRVHRQLTESAQTWASLDRDPGALYRGTRLDSACELARPLSPVERDFLDASIRQRDSERAASARRARLLRNLTVGLAVLLVVAVAAGLIALRQGEEAKRAHRTAVSRQLAAQALAMADVQPGTAMLLSAEAFGFAETVEARGALLSMSAHLAHHGDLTGHTNSISDVAFSPDGRLIASASADRTVLLWDTRDRTRRATITGHDTWLRAVTFSPDGRLLATAGDDRRVMLWNAADRTRVATLAGHTASVEDVAFSPDGRLLATSGADHTAILWDTTTWTKLATLAGHTDLVINVEFSPSGRNLLTASLDGTAKLWNVRDRVPVATLAGHTHPIAAGTFSPDGRVVATAGHDDTIRLWDAENGVALAVLTGHTKWVRALAYSEDGRTLVSASDDRTVMLWDTANRVPRARMTGHANNIYTVAVDPRTGMVASADENGVIMFWEPTRTRFSLPAHGDANDVAFSQDGRVAAVTSGTTTTLWDTASRAPLATLPGHTATILAATFSPDGRVLATSGEDGTVMVWDLARRVPVATVGIHRGYVMDVAISQDGALLAAGNEDGTVTLWDLTRRTSLATLDGHTAAVDGVAFSPDGRTLVTASHDHRVLLWDVGRRAMAATLTGHTGWIRSAVVSPDGRTVATADIDQTVILWDLASRTRLATLTGHAEGLNGIAFSPDGRTLAFTSTDNTITLWDTTRRALSARLAGHTQPVTAVTFSPDGDTLASTSIDDTTILWQTDPADTTSGICAALARNLTHSEWAQHIPEMDYHETCA